MKPSTTTPFHLVWFTAHGPRNWDLPDFANYDWRRPELYMEMASVLENRGGFDAVIFADGSAIQDQYQGKIDTYVKYGLEGIWHDPVPMLAAMSRATSRLGLVGTLSTSLYPPYLLARLMSTMDHLTGGRAGWNIVTSTGPSVARNYGMDDLPAHDERYERADEYVELVESLWDSWEDGAVVADRETGRFADPAKVRTPDYAGRWYRARGPLTAPRSPQGKPVIMQAGGSDRGRRFAATHAEIIITHRNSVPAMKEFRDDMRARIAAAGRDPDAVKIFFTVRPFVGETAAEAKAARARILAKPTINVEVGLANFSSRAGYDFSRLPLDEPIPADLPIHGSQSMLPQYYGTGATPTLREVALSEAMKETFVVEGSPADVADEMTAVMAEVGGDGFAIRETLLPSFVIPFTDRVVPLLRRRGAVRREYHHSTFRANLLDPHFAK